MRAIVFDDGKPELSPLTDLRASFDVRTGARTTLHRIEALLPDDVEINTFPIQKKVWEKRLRRNWKDYQPWFWRTGSALKQAVRRIAGQGTR